MEQISAANNYSVQTNGARWRLLYNNRPLLEAAPQGIRYGKYFSQTRRLPTTGQLPRQEVVRVVLGWQRADEAWHLGLLLSDDLAAQRGSRWCEMASWPDPDVTVFQNLAETAGRNLAQSLRIPFQVIPPRTAAQPRPAQKPLPDLPLNFGLWSLQPTAQPGVVEFRRSPRWIRQHVRLIAWYALWAVVYFGVSVVTITSEIALPNAGTLLPNPQWLPFLGIATSIFFVIAIVYQLLRISLVTNRILVDGNRGSVSAWRGNNKHWERTRAEIQSVYVSELFKKHDLSHTTEHGELNLHFGGGKFHFVLKQGDAVDNSGLTNSDDRQPHQKDDLRQLTADDVTTSLQAAGLHIAALIGDIPVWHDVRVGRA